MITSTYRDLSILISHFSSYELQKFQIRRLRSLQYKASPNSRQLVHPGYREAVIIFGKNPYSFRIILVNPLEYHQKQSL